MYSFITAAAWEILVTVCAAGKEQTLKQVQKKKGTKVHNLMHHIQRVSSSTAYSNKRSH